MFYLLINPVDTVGEATLHFCKVTEVINADLKKKSVPSIKSNPKCYNALLSLFKKISFSQHVIIPYFGS